VSRLQGATPGICAWDVCLEVKLISFKANIQAHTPGVLPCKADAPSCYCLSGGCACAVFACTLEEDSLLLLKLITRLARCFLLCR
jgi:hypothetical protein